MLGLGERSGGVPTEEMAVALEFLYGYDTGVDLRKLKDVAAVFQEISGVELSGNKPVIGRNSFSYEAGIAAMFSYRLFKEDLPLNVVPYLPELVGGNFEIVMGKKAGIYNIMWHLDRTGQSASEDQIRDMVELIKAKSIEHRRMISSEEFDAIYKSVISSSSS